MNDLSRGDGTKKSLVSASEDTEGDIEIIIQEDSAIHNKDENAYQSKLSITLIRYIFSHLY